MMTERSDKRIKAYLNVLIVAIPFSTVSGVPVRSWEPSRGAIYVGCAQGAQDTRKMISDIVKWFDGLWLMNPCEKFNVLCWWLWWDDIGLNPLGENFRLPPTYIIL